MSKRKGYLEFFLIFLLIAVIYQFNLTTGKLLILGIFSAPDHFYERLLIRRTWLKSIRGDPSVSYYFILGHSMCSIPPEVRRTPYGCERLTASSGSFYNEANLLTISTAVRKVTRTSIFATGFGFRVDRSIVATHIGLPECVASRLSAPVRIKFVDAYDRKELVSVSFSAFDEGTGIKSIRPISFPQMSEGIVYMAFMEPSDEDLCKCSELSWNEEQLVSFTSMLLDGRSVLFNNSTNICAFMQYNKTSKPNHKSAKSLEFKPVLFLEVMDDVEQESYDVLWQNKTQQISGDIEGEQQTFKDLLIVNVTDYYNNLPEKLLSFFQHIEGEEFKFLLKVDDDSFVDVPRVVAELRNVKTEKLWWWSTFKEYHQVPLSGKWLERKYASATYPPFPCGGGYVINRQVVHYLNLVSNHLATFQGEDVSIGIWLAATDIERHRPSGGNMPNYKDIMLQLCVDTCQWVCDSIVKRGTCNLVQLSNRKLRDYWHRYTQHKCLLT